MNHDDKLKIARRMLTNKEKRNGVPPFQSAAWNERVENRQNRELSRHLQAEEKKLAKQYGR